jgi:hypothetical protein
MEEDLRSLCLDGGRRNDLDSNISTMPQLQSSCGPKFVDWVSLGVVWLEMRVFKNESEHKDVQT